MPETVRYLSGFVVARILEIEIEIRLHCLVANSPGCSFLDGVCFFLVPVLVIGFPFYTSAEAQSEHQTVFVLKSDIVSGSTEIWCTFKN